MVLSRTLCAAWLWLVCVASLAAVTADAHAHEHEHARDAYASRKRAELMQETYLPDHQLQLPSRELRSQSKFWSGSRYGRSGQGGGGGGGASQSRLEVEPRGDRFFMGSRYGKRAGRFPARTTRMSAYNNLVPYDLPPPAALPRPLRPRR